MDIGTFWLTYFTIGLVFSGLVHTFDPQLKPYVKLLSLSFWTVIIILTFTWPISLTRRYIPDLINWLRGK